MCLSEFQAELLDFFVAIMGAGMVPTVGLLRKTAVNSIKRLHLQSTSPTIAFTSAAGNEFNKNRYTSRLWRS